MYFKVWLASGKGTQAMTSRKKGEEKKRQVFQICGQKVGAKREPAELRKQ